MATTIVLFFLSFFFFCTLTIVSTHYTRVVTRVYIRKSMRALAISRDNDRSNTYRYINNAFNTENYKFIEDQRKCVQRIVSSRNRHGNALEARTRTYDNKDTREKDSGRDNRRYNSRLGEKCLNYLNKLIWHTHTYAHLHFNIQCIHIFIFFFFNTIYVYISLWL